MPINFVSLFFQEWKSWLQREGNPQGKPGALERELNQQEFEDK